MKLNYKRTLLVGFAFFLICAFWQAYDTIIPLMLTNRFGLSQTLSGFIMSLDNILALFMLPLFGAISDKKNTKYGKRTPFIFIGTICAIVCFVGLTFADAAQLKKVSEGTKADFWAKQEYVIENKEYNAITNRNVPKEYTVQDYAAHMLYNKSFADPSVDQEAVKNWYCGENLNFDTMYVYDRNTNTYRLIEIDTKGSGLFSSDTYHYVDNPTEIVGSDARKANAYSAIVSSAENQYAHEVMRINVWILVIFIAVLLMTLVAMATFRSPAVALMPDVTVKPLRSKANAVINLMGTVGGILVLLLGIVFGTGKVKNQMKSYTGFILTVCGIMLAALVAFILTVKEKQWNTEMLEQQALLDAENPEETTEEEAVITEEKLPKEKLRSLILILASVALWFIGYNAITSKYSVYAVNVLNKDYNTTLLIAQAAAVVSYIPVGILASKIGRKKSILIGVGLLTASFFGAIFIDNTSSPVLISVLFALAGIAWATINVNSFPMVVELSKGGNIGKYTGYYYTASMAAQVVTPLLSGWLMDIFHTMKILFPYATIFVALSFVTMLFVKHGDSKPETPQDKMELLAGADD